MLRAVPRPGALRNGAPFKGWQLPNALGRLRTRLAGHDDGDRQSVKVLAAVLEDGLEAVEAACAEALDCGACSGSIRNFVLWAIVMKKKGASYGNREGTIGPAVGGA